VRIVSTRSESLSAQRASLVKIETFEDAKMKRFSLVPLVLLVLLVTPDSERR